MRTLLGIDVGTSSVKAVLFNPDVGKIEAAAAQEYPLHKPAPGYAEHQPDDWWQAAAAAVKAALASTPEAEVKAIGLCGQMHGTAFLDRAGDSIRPAIIWADQRSGEECSELLDLIGAGRFSSITGTLPAAGFAAPTLLWLRKHEPATLDHTHMLLLPKDYVRYQLTDELGTDASDAAATALFDISIKAWSPEIVQTVGISRSILPPIHDSSAVVGRLTKAAAATLGLSAGVPVVTGCADQPAQALTNGLIKPGRASVTVGSGGQVFVPVAPDHVAGLSFRLPTDPRVHVFNHALPSLWYVLGATLTAGLSLRWLRGLLGKTAEGSEAYAQFSREAAETAPGADGLLFLPYLTGERTPHMDSRARGSFVGLSYHHERGHLARAVMEGVAFSLHEALNISIAIGGSVETVVAAGGAMDSPVWRQIMADVLGIPLNRTGFSETTGIGAALLAGVGCGIYSTYGEACALTSRTVQVTEPNPAHRARYDALFARYQGLYPKLRDDFHALSDSVG
ncbi:MAG: xylulokinase [Anaerolineae bacterium]|nr:xylulokinase [Anaerolineae bacterium]